MPRETDHEQPTHGRDVVPRWLEWVRRLQSIAQAGVTYARDPYDLERYRQVASIAAEIAAEHSTEDASLIGRFFASEHGYPTPKIDVRAAVVVDGRILLVQERDDGRWSMPGGWADIGESAAESVVRETREEAGVEVRATKLLALFERERRGHPVHPQFSYKAFFGCELCDTSPPEAGPETRDAAFFDRREIPELSLPRVTRAEIELAFRHASDPSLATEFD